MAKIITKNEELLQVAKNKAHDVINYREMKDGRIIVSKRPNKKSKRKR